MIDERFETRGVEVLFPQQVYQNARIEIAAARPHDRPSGRGQAHAGIYGLAAFDGGDTGAIAQMRNDQSIRPIIPKLSHDRLAGKAMKPVALNAARPQPPRDRQCTRDIRHPGVKYRIEAGDLWQLWEMLLRKSDNGQGWRIVQWSKGDGSFDLPQHGVVDQAMTTKIGPTVHHAMSDRRRLGIVAIIQERSDACERILLRSKIRRF